MSSPSRAGTIIVIERGVNGRPVRIVPPNEDEAICISACAILAIACTKDPKVRGVFDALGRAVDTSLPAGAEPSKDFFERIDSCFPLLIYDPGLDNLNTAACHYRRVKEGGEFFEMWELSIVLNAQRVRALCDAMKAAEANKDLQSREHQILRNYTFQVSTTVLHELGHVFVSYLKNGKVGTPPHIYGNLDPNRHNSEGESDHPLGESGKFVEAKVFGGEMTIYLDPDEDGSQPGMPYLVTMEGNLKISQQTMDNFVLFRFEFPIPREQLGIRKTPGLKTPGADMPETSYRHGDPMEHPGIRKLLEEYGAELSKQDAAIGDLIKNENENPKPKTFSDQDEEFLRKVLFDPSLRSAKAPTAQAVK